MVKKTIRFVDFNGKECVEEHYFNLNEIEFAELMDLTVGEKGDAWSKLSDQIAVLLASAEKDAKQIFGLFKKIIRASYGIKSADGRRFVKNDPETGRPYVLDFFDSAAYPAMIMEFSTDPDSVQKFFSQLVPKSIMEEATDISKEV